MSSRSDLDFHGDRALRVRHGGRVGELAHPASLSWTEVISAVESLPAFMTLLAREAPLSQRVALKLQGIWSAHHDLPDGRSCRRLAFTVNRYRDAIEADLAPMDLDALWSARRWRYLLNLVDHLPRTSWYSQAVANDEEHAEALAKAQGPPRDSKEPYRPPLTHYSPEYELLQSVVNELRMLRTITVAANSAKGKTSQPEFLLGPSTALSRNTARYERERRKAKHEAIVARVLPHKVG